jgi:tocopherol cyclase
LYVVVKQEYHPVRTANMICRGFRKIWKPAVYQGKRSMKGYFEGWYYKFGDKEGKNIGALIPGVSFDAEGRHPHAFIQFLDDSGILSHYFRYDIKDFSYSDKNAGIGIAGSFFSPAGIDINIKDAPNTIKGTQVFKGITPWPVKLFSPGAMGWYAFVPAMECYHGVLSFDHLIEGRLELNGKCIDYTGGRGYIEKDWGRSFPKYHIWIQTNHFEKPGTSLMISIANVPWLGSSFDGFIIGLQHEGVLYRFTTYTGAKITSLHYDKERLVLSVNSKKLRLEVEVSCLKGAELLTPVRGDMQGRLSESLAASTHLKLFQLDQGAEKLLFEGAGRHTGLEIEGELPLRLIKDKK